MAVKIWIGCFVLWLDIVFSFEMKLCLSCEQGVVVMAGAPLEGAPISFPRCLLFGVCAVITDLEQVVGSLKSVSTIFC